ncbi:hypothetical protein DXG03_007403 [Asterophora parasitica]|uniref:Uncharacterized protein n=1 Tax=Asterophora parasitica TaxID=117018 RepID=A0A9P7KBV0_9AGAR|nr:hypothetical protein DXG03_007403 [Asterophora parasitica]
MVCRNKPSLVTPKFVLTDDVLLRMKLVTWAQLAQLKASRFPEAMLANASDGLFYRDFRWL